MLKHVFVTVLLMLPLAVEAQVKVGGREIVPKGLIFADADPSSRVSAEGELDDGCSWTLTAETRFAEDRVEEDCLLDYRRTTVLLTKKCPPPAKPEPVIAERTTTAPASRCPDDNGAIDPPEIDTKLVSSGSTPDGRQQAILTQADGTRLTMSWDGTGVRVMIRFPDTTTDMLQIAGEELVEE